MDLLREQVKQRLSAAADEVIELFVKSMEDYVELVRSQNPTPKQTGIRPDSAESQESLVQLVHNPCLDLRLSLPVQIKQEPAEPETLWSYQEEQQLLKMEAFPSPAGQMHKNHEGDNSVFTVKGVRPESVESQESQEQLVLNPCLDLGLALHIKQEPAEPETLWSHQEEQQLQKMEMVPSPAGQMNPNQEGDNSLFTVKVGSAAPPVLLNGPEPPEEPEWSSSVKQELKGAEVSTESSLPAEKSEDDEAKASLPPQMQSNEVVPDKQMEGDSDGDDGGDLETAPQPASEETANSSDVETEDSEDEWEKSKETHHQPAKVVSPEPARNDSNEEGQKADPTPMEVEEDKVPEPPCSSSSVCDPVNEEKTSDSSDAESEDSNQQQRKDYPVGMKLLPREAASSKHHSGKKSGKKTKKSTKKQSAGHNLPCPDCGKVFNYRSNLLRHMKSHSTSSSGTNKIQEKDKNIFACSACNKAFTEKTHLDLHVRIHQVNIKAYFRNKDVGSGGAG